MSSRKTQIEPMWLIFFDTHAQLSPEPMAINLYFNSQLSEIEWTVDKTSGVIIIALKFRFAEHANNYSQNFFWKIEIHVSPTLTACFSREADEFSLQEEHVLVAFSSLSSLQWNHDRPKLPKTEKVWVFSTFKDNFPPKLPGGFYSTNVFLDGFLFSKGLL